MNSALQDETTNKLPVELWREIFAHTTAVASKDEWTVEGSAHNLMICDDYPVSAALTREETLNTIKMRLNIVKVCKSWYAMGIQTLWSHLPLKASDTVFLQLDEILNKHPDLGRFVIRLSISSSSRHKSVDIVLLHNLIRNSILPRFPSLRIISCPLAFGLGVYPFQPDVVLLQQPPVLEHSLIHSNLSLTGGSHFWHITRTLHINLAHLSSPIDYCQDIDFPRLENLRIAVFTDILTEYVTRRWKTPKLRELSVNSRGHTENAWISFIEKCQQMEKLDICIGTGFNISRTIHMPELLALYTTANFTTSWASVIKAPKLYRLGIRNLTGSAQSQAFFELSNSIFTHYPDIKVLCISYGRTLHYVNPKIGERFGPQDLISWYQETFLLEFTSLEY